MQTLEREIKLSEQIDSLSDIERDVVCGGDEVACLPQGIHMDDGRLGINESPTRLC